MTSIRTRAGRPPGRPWAPLSLLLAAACACAQQAGDAARDSASPPPAASAATAPGAPFVERARDSGIDFVHFNGMSGEFYLLETLGPGAALFDYDGDGDLDLYLVQGVMLGPGKPISAALVPPGTGPLALRDRLLRNDLRETGTLHFTDVTERSGIVSSAYGMGVAVGDYDRDGDEDLFVTRFGANLFLRNNGDGTFTDVTERTGTAMGLWSTSAAFVDYDHDGWPDLFVVNYVDFTYASNKACYLDTGARDYCGPQSFNPYPSRLFRNRHDGTFEDVSASSGIALHYGAGLGVVCADLNGDHRVDIYVANDQNPNNLFINRGDGTFEDVAMLAGCALSAKGQAQSGMGIDAGDFDGDGDLDLIVTNLTGEMNVLYVNDGSGTFDDSTAGSGLGPPSLPYTGFGAGWVDYDNDGWLDLIVANGAVKKIPDLAQRGDPYPLHQINSIYHNTGGHFEDVTAQAGPAFALSEVSRGAVFGDVDNDGDTDVVITNNSGPTRLLINQIGSRRHWLGLRLVETANGADALGTEVDVVRNDGRLLRRRVHADGSFLASSDPRVLVGLGDSNGVRSVRARWPDGALEEWTELQPDRYTVLVRGTGRAIEPAR